MALPDERFEICYLIDDETRERILPALRLRLLPCPLAGPGGSQHVQSLYFGAPPEPGAEPRRRLRVRLHESASRPVRCVVEVKHRVGLRSVVRHAPVALHDVVALANGLPVPGGPVAAGVLDEALDLVRRGLKPSVLVAHDRIALVGDESESDLRVTLDSAVTFRVRDLAPRPHDARSDGDVLAPGQSLLVVKVARSVPNWLTLLLGRSGTAHRSPGKHALATHAAALFAPEGDDETRTLGL